MEVWVVLNQKSINGHSLHNCMGSSKQEMYQWTGMGSSKPEVNGETYTGICINGGTYTGVGGSKDVQWRD